MNRKTVTTVVTPELYRLSDVCAALAVGRSTVYALLETDDSFPRPIRIARRAVRWHRTDVERWARSRPAARSRTPPRSESGGTTA